LVATWEAETKVQSQPGVSYFIGHKLILCKLKIKENNQQIEKRYRKVWKCILGEETYKKKMFLVGWQSGSNGRAPA
jgi:hypothetical protein